MRGGALQGGLECTDWDMFVNSSDNLDQLVGVTTDYIKFCVDTVVPDKKVKVYANSKPWVTGEVIKAIRHNRDVFLEGDFNKNKEAQKKLDKVIKKGKGGIQGKGRERFLWE